MDRANDKLVLIFSFFEDKQYYDKAVNLCAYLYKDRVIAPDKAHDVLVYLSGKPDKIDFPEDKERAWQYVKKCIYRKWYYDLRVKGKLPQIVIIREELDSNESEDDETINYSDGVDDVLNIADTEDPDIGQRLDNLNALIMASRHLFSEEQLKLWKCMYELNTVGEMEEILGKDSQAIYDLVYKLRMKIRRLFKMEDLS